MARGGGSTAPPHWQESGKETKCSSKRWMGDAGRRRDGHQRGELCTTWRKTDFYLGCRVARPHAPAESLMFVGELVDACSKIATAMRYIARRAGSAFPISEMKLPVPQSCAGKVALPRNFQVQSQAHTAFGALGS